MRWERLGSAPSLPVVVSYHTGGLYTRDAFELARSCLALGLDYSIELVPDLRSWERNTGHKPAFLQRKSIEFPARSLLWVDADARFRARPSLLDGLETPLAAHVWRRHGQAELLSGTVFLGSDRDGVLAAWAREVAARPQWNDQQCLALVAEKIAGFVELPQTYCWIYDLMPRIVRGHELDPALDQDAVIVHMQSSRFTRTR